MKKNILVMIGNVVLFLLLAGLMVLEIKNPQGGAAMLSDMMGMM